MQLNVNGKTENFNDASTISQLLARYDLAPVRVAVELNRELVAREDFDRTPLTEGDSIEIVTFVGGG